MDDGLRDDALDALGSRDKLARHALEAGRVELEPTGAGWESSHGWVTAMRVVLYVDPATLAQLDASPLSRIELERALGTAFAARPHESMTELSTRWGRANARTASYRDAPSHEVDSPTDIEVAAALRTYLAAAGLDALARSLSGSSVVVLPTRVVVRRADGARPMSDRERPRVVRALARLLEPASADVTIH